MISLIEYPKRKKGLILAAVASIIVHIAIIGAIRNATFLSLAMGLREIEFVEEDYNRLILINFSKKLKYPAGYAGFRAPEKIASLDDIKKAEARREAAERRRKQKEDEERREREAREVAEREAEVKAKADALAKAEKDAREQELAKAAADPVPTPTPKPAESGYGRFGKINTRPIKEQLQRLYDAKKEGKLVIPDGKFKVGVEGSIAADGTIASYRISVPSGIEEIDEAAKAILAAVSESRALGALHSLTSLSLVLEIDQTAELRVVGYANTEQDAADITSLAQVALLAARLRKSEDPTAMIMLNNLKVSRAGSRINAVISVPRQQASDSLANAMNKEQPQK
jgi:hypothetical protein